MTIYYTIIFILLLLGHFQRQGALSKKKFCIIMGTIFALVTGLRNDVVGSDTTVYLIGYENLHDISTWQEAIHGHGDIAYYILAWSYSHLLELPFWCLTLTVGVFFYYTVSRLIYRYSADCALSFLILMAFNFFQFSMTGIRQTIAFGFVLLALYEAFKLNYKLYRILLFIFIGYLFHNSCAVFLLIIPILYLKDKVNITFIIISILILLIGFIIRNQLMIVMMAISADSRFAAYGIMENSSAGYATYLLFFAIYILMVFYNNRYVEENRRGSLDVGLLFFAVLFQGTVLIQPVMFRITWYFAISLIIILPELIRSIPNSNRSMANAGVYIGVLFMYLKITIGSANVVPYLFFWQ